MKNATMLYKAPGPHAIHGGFFDYTIVDADEEGAIKAAEAAGWCKTTLEAQAALEAAMNKPPTRDELETKARELNIPYGRKTSDEELSRLIQAKLRV